eukprot:131163_1
MSSPLNARNNYTGVAIQTLNNEELEKLLYGDNNGNNSYLDWEKKYLQRRFHKSEYLSKLKSKFKERALAENHREVSFQQLVTEQELNENKVQSRFDKFIKIWNYNGNKNKPLLILDVDNTLIYVRYFSSEMEIGDLVTFFKTNSKINQNNAKVIQLKQTLTLQITNNQFIIGSIIM